MVCKQVDRASKSNTRALWGRESWLKRVVVFMQGPFIRKMVSFHPCILMSGPFYSRPCNNPAVFAGYAHPVNDPEEDALVRQPIGDLDEWLKSALPIAVDLVI